MTHHRITYLYVSCICRMCRIHFLALLRKATDGSCSSKRPASSTRPWILFPRRCRPGIHCSGYFLWNIQKLWSTLATSLRDTVWVASVLYRAQSSDLQINWLKTDTLIVNVAYDCLLDGIELNWSPVAIVFSRYCIWSQLCKSIKIYRVIEVQ